MSRASSASRVRFAARSLTRAREACQRCGRVSPAAAAAATPTPPQTEPNRTEPNKPQRHTPHAAAQVYGMHNWPTNPLGQCGVKPGPLMAHVAEFEIVVRGKGVHASQPHAGVDAVLVGATLVQVVLGGRHHLNLSRGPFSCGHHDAFAFRRPHASLRDVRERERERERARERERREKREERREKRE